MSDHYRRAASLADILDRLGDTSSEGLAPIDQFHSGGLAATRELARLAAIKPGETVLDVGCGIGGPARLLVREHGAVVTGVDLSERYIEIGRALSKRAGVAIDLEKADALHLPFPDGGFDVVWTQHVAMNIADRERLYSEFRRVLRPQGRLAFHDLLAGQTPGPLHFPVPWADRPEDSFLIEPENMRAILVRAGFHALLWQDRTAATIAFFNNLPAATPTPPPLGIHLLLGPGFPVMAANLRRNFSEARLVAIMGVLAAGFPAAMTPKV
jgi:SAM-dependent methyltransferase